MKKIVFAIFIVFAFLLIFVSCKGENTDTAGVSGSETPGIEDNAHSGEESVLPGRERISTEYLPTTDYGGFEYWILSFGDANNPVQENFDIIAEEQNGESLNDAVYLRNIAVEERFNIKIKDKHALDGNNYNTLLNNAVRSQDETYSLATLQMVSALPNMVAGCFCDLYKVPIIDLKQPWYLQQGIEQMSVGGGLFAVLSEMLVSPYGATWLVLFNKDLHKDYNLADPYEMVKKGTWTLDALHEMAKTGTKDLDGDEILGPLDQYGIVSPLDGLLALLIGGGGEAGTKTKDTYSVTFNNEKNINIFYKIFEFFYDENVTLNINKPANLPALGGSTTQGTQSVLSRGAALFMISRMNNMKLAREVDHDYGMLPIPKLNEKQQNYRNYTSPNQTHGLAVPVSTPDLDRSAVIMEALSAESRYTVIPAFVENMLKIKLARDNESAEMIPYILENTFIDPLFMYDYGGIQTHIWNLSLKNDTNIQSLYEKILPVVESAIENMRKALDN